MPLISIIVPVYNTERYLNRCINSIVNQTFSDFELILVDDGSSDNSGAVCDGWSHKDNRIKVIHKKNDGAGAARNTGLSIARGRYIGFVDSDDWIEPEMYQRLYDTMKEYSAHVTMVKLVGRRNNRNERQKPNNQVYTATVKNQDEMLARFFRIHGEDASINSICIKLVNKRILKNFHFLEGTICEDVFASFYFIMHSQTTVIIDSPLYNYFQNSTGVTKNKVTKKDFEYIDAYKRIYKIVQKLYPSFVHVANLNFLRSNFTVLSKMRLYGYDKTDASLQNKYDDLKSIVRKNFWQLVTWNMPLSRKFLLILVCL